MFGDKFTMSKGLLLISLITCIVVFQNACDAEQGKPPNGFLPSSANAKQVEINPPPTINDRDKLQSTFHAEDGIKFPIEIPSGVLESILHSDTYIPNDCRRSLDQQTPCFVASYASINHDTYVDMVVMGQNAMMGANVTTFWVFRGTYEGYKLVLLANGLQLDIGEKKINGFFQIDVVRTTATRIFVESYRYDGKEYKFKGETQEDI